MRKVLVIQPIHERGLDLLRSQPDVRFEAVTDIALDTLRRAIADADGVIVRTAPLPASVLDAAERLLIVSRHGVGTDNVDVAALDRRGIPLTVVGDVNAVSVAEHTLSMMLGLAKRTIRFDRATREGDYALRQRLFACELWRKTLLIVGFGRVGRAVAPRTLAFDMIVEAYDPLVPAEVITAAGCRPVADLHAALGGADFVSLHAPLGEATANLIGERELAAMKPSAFLINCARGGLVDEPALRLALTSGRIAGAGLDTLSVEPPPRDHPLLDLDSVLLSPHTAALTEEAAVRMALVCVRNVLDCFAGRLDPQLVVNRAALARPARRPRPATGRPS